MVRNFATNVVQNLTMCKTLISIVGPTAIGKTALSIKLAQHFNTEIISADSRQFFKEMTIGTAVPSKEELRAAKHHFIQHISIKQPYSVGDFEKDAIKKLDNLFTTHNVVIMVGGSGLYTNSIINGLDKFPDINPNIREELNTKLQIEGIKTLQNRLKSVDLKSYNTIAIDNPQRLIRALEICIGTGKPYSSFINKEKNKREFRTVSIGITAEREIIYNRINERVDIMLKEGLIEEAKQLYPQRALNALNTVGYKELFHFFEENWTLEFAVSEIKKNTRRFAKRQITWFKKDQNTVWFDYKANVAEIINTISSNIKA